MDANDGAILGTEQEDADGLDGGGGGAEGVVVRGTQVNAGDKSAE